MSFSLRPVSQSPSAIPPMQSPPIHFRPPSSMNSPRDPTRARRPMSPSSLRDVDLTHGPDAPPRPYPAPPTGHELMALFPPNPPTTLNDQLANTGTSSYFRREERAFFAQGDREIVRVRIDMDLPQGYDRDRKNGYDKGKGREPLANQNGNGPRPYLAQMPSLPPAPTNGSMPPPNPAPNAVSSTRHARSTSFHTSPRAQHLPHHTQPPLPRGLQHDSAGQPHSDNHHNEFHPEDMQQDSPDEAWRRPMPYAERRRAGKHTKRVIVRS